MVKSALLGSPNQLIGSPAEDRSMTMFTRPGIGEDVAPQHRDRDRSAEDRRHVVGGAEEVDRLQPVVEDHRDEEREGELQRHREKDVKQGHAQRLAGRCGRW